MSRKPEDPAQAVALLTLDVPRVGSAFAGLPADPTQVVQGLHEGLSTGLTWLALHTFQSFEDNVADFGQWNT
jgi:hypothetical protein